MSRYMTESSAKAYQGLFTYENKIGDVYERCRLFNGQAFDQVVVYPHVIKFFRGQKVLSLPRNVLSHNK